jgi:hypothetical protein
LVALAAGGRAAAGSNPAVPTLEGSAAWAAAGLESRSPVKAGGFDSWAFRHAGMPVAAAATFQILMTYGSLLTTSHQDLLMDQ